MFTVEENLSFIIDVKESSENRDLFEYKQDEILANMLHCD